ncbi:MAG: penicillin acylase family protein [Acidimicrobiales bacterium]
MPVNNGDAAKLSRCVLFAAALASGVVAGGAPWAAATPGLPPSPGFSAILPPGESGTVAAGAFLQNQIDGKCADFGPHFCDRLDPYLSWQWDGDSLRTSPTAQPGDTVETLREGAVRILRDAATGEPHIWGAPDRDTSGAAAQASSLANMAYGIGVAEAEDRLFQLEIFRRAGEGTLSELLGPSMLHYDEQYRRDTETSLERATETAAHLDPVARAGLDGYVAGINEIIARDTRNPTLLPAEFTLLADTPMRPWTEGDSLAIGTLEIKAEAEAGGQEMVVASDLQKLAAAGRGIAGAAGLLDDWYFRQDQSTPPSIPPGSGTAAGPGPAVYAFSAADTRTRLSSLPPGLATWPEAGVNLAGRGTPTAVSGQNLVARTIFTLGLPHFGSNAVAVAPAHTTFGGALLYGGPQAGYDVPAVFERLEAHAVGLDVAGVAVPGSGPLVVIGHTPSVAWSITTGQDDQVDSYLERVRRDPANPGGADLQVWYRGSWRRVESRVETFRYRALNNPLPVATSVTPPVYETVTTRVYRTRHAGIPSPIVALQWDAGGATGWAISKTRAFWNTATTSGKVFENIGFADGPGSFGAAVLATPPAFNFMYADAAGHIGYWHAGIVPLRAPGHDPRLPAAGDGSMDWVGYLSEQQTPHVLDPPQGWIASWNNRAALNFPDSGDGTVWGTNQRVLGLQRDIAARLDAGRIDAAGLSGVMEAVGSHDLPARLYFRDILLRLREPRSGAPALSAPAREALSRVGAWNGDVYYPYGANPATVADPAATIFDRWFHDLEDAVLRPVFEPVGPSPWTVNGFDDATTGPADGGRSEFFDNLEPIVLHAVQAVPTIPLHIDWLPAWATGATRQERIDHLSAVVLERAVAELSSKQGYKTTDQKKWLEPSLHTTYMSLGAGSVPDQPFQNRGVFAILAAFPAPTRPAGGTSRPLPAPPRAPVSTRRRLPATGAGDGGAALGMLAAMVGLLALAWARRRWPSSREP